MNSLILTCLTVFSAKTALAAVAFGAAEQNPGKIPYDYFWHLTYLWRNLIGFCAALKPVLSMGGWELHNMKKWKCLKIRQKRSDLNFHA